MRRKYWLDILVLAVLSAVTNSLLNADDTVRQPLGDSTGEIRIVESLVGQTGSKQSAALKSSETEAKPRRGVPTPAKRVQPKVDVLPSKAAVETKPEPPADAIATKVDPSDKNSVEEKDADEALPGEQTPTDATSAKQSSADGDEPLRPIPDAMESGPLSLEAASFNGVTPGVSTQADVEKAWGQPKEMAKQGEDIVQLYAVPPFNRVEVCYQQDKVASVIIRFDRAFPPNVVAKQLDLATVRPVLVSNELGEVLGLAYPERGVLFAFESGGQSEKTSMKVTQLIIEPISAEPFVLRAETTLESRCDLSLRDLEQALLLEPNNARAHWLQSRALSAMKRHEEAVEAAGRAVRLDPENPHYRVTYAQVLARNERLDEALEQARKAADDSASRPHVKARATCLMGDLTASGLKPDYRKALALHTQAIMMADPLTADPHPAIRIAAKEVLVDAHLGAAHDIAWGDWKEKEKSVARWLERAATAADDLVANEGGGKDLIFRVQVRSLSACVGMRGNTDIEPMVKTATTIGNELIEATRDPARKTQLQWELGLALYDATQIYQMRADYDRALQTGRQAADYLVKADQGKPTPISAFQLGRLYFRIGAVHAVGKKNHLAAVEWFDKAVPLLKTVLPDDLAHERGRHGESFVSMGVSYWEAGQREKALALTQQGIKLMEQAADDGAIDRSTLAIPYSNLAAMHRKLGATDLADRFQEMASRVKEERLK